MWRTYTQNSAGVPRFRSRVGTNTSVPEFVPTKLMSIPPPSLSLYHFSTRWQAWPAGYITATDPFEVNGNFKRDRKWP